MCPLTQHTQHIWTFKDAGKCSDSHEILSWAERSRNARFIHYAYTSFSSLWMWIHEYISQKCIVHIILHYIYRIGSRCLWKGTVAVACLGDEEESKVLRGRYEKKTRCFHTYMHISIYTSLIFARLGFAYHRCVLPWLSMIRACAQLPSLSEWLTL